MALDFQQIEVEHSLVVFSYEVDLCLTEDGRGLLWNRYGVPVFEQLLGSSNELLASECEAHDGLHLHCEWPAGLLEYQSCPCGKRQPRMLRTPRIQTLAAST